MTNKNTPVVDLFAGPGGLGEGFSGHCNPDGGGFAIRLSVEKDEIAHKTLKLRSFVRQFTNPPSAYYARLRGDLSTVELYSKYPTQAEHAEREAVCIELGPQTRSKTDKLVSAALQSIPKRWVLIGGPPCQAYSLVGRSRMKGSDPEAYERDGRHFLYREYLRILREFQPPVFVMENVKGILSSTIGGRRIFNDILRDLRACGYTIHSFVRADTDRKEPEPADFVIRAEEYGIPQARHRVVLLGLRNGLERGNKMLRPQLDHVSIEDAIRDLPSIRSELSERGLNGHSWEIAIRRAEGIRIPADVAAQIKQTLRHRSPVSSGQDFIPTPPDRRRMRAWLRENSEWFLDPKLEGIVHHSARSHMESDLHRYLFASCFAKIHHRSPSIKDFPRNLWPHHKNVKAAADGDMFSDRFRVQVAGRPATTVVSHISKDGHYFIHYDPIQCRSLTVREAARLQTFPDNYFFEGGRTAQYHQVGNAVPPLLARQLAAVVQDVLKQI